MCWDVALHTDLKIVKKNFPEAIDERDSEEMNMYLFENVQAITFPDYPILYRDKKTVDLAIRDMEWGVLPTYIKDLKEQTDRRRNQVNVRSERILGDSKSLWSRLKNQRCLIPVSGTYEHRKIDGWKKKVPYYITEKGREICYIPGLYQWHEIMDGDGVMEKIGSFGMLTRSANQAMADIHNDGPNKGRMPLYLPAELEKEWLSDINDLDIAAIMDFQMPETQMEYYPVYTLRGYPQRPDGLHRYDPFHWEGLPPLGNDDPNSIQVTLF